MGKGSLAVWMWRLVPIAGLIGVRLVKHIAADFLPVNLLADGWLLVGWILGWLLADSDHWFYALVCNPHELSCQRVKGELGKKDLKNAWAILVETAHERTQLPIRNVLTAFVMTGVGVWLTMSYGSLIAVGLCLGFAVRLFSEVLAEPDYQKWYWVFSRKFAASEHKGLMIGWGIVLIWQWLVLARG